MLYCNGPYCGKSKRLAAELVAAGFKNVRRYQLGIPVWRALEGYPRSNLLESRRVLVMMGQRWSSTHGRRGVREGSFPQPGDPRELVLPGKDTGEVRRAKDDGRLPMEDHNTRILVVGRDARRPATRRSARARGLPQCLVFSRGLRGGSQGISGLAVWSQA